MHPVAVVGGGIIGLGVAWRLAQAGRPVVVLERDRAGRGASRVAAGMIAPVAEAGFDDLDFVRFGRTSLEKYPGFLADLERDSGETVPFEHSGSLSVALHRDDVEAMRRTYDYRRSVDLPVEWISGTRAREIEPTLTPRVSAAMWIPSDGQVDTRALMPALVRACERRGVEIREGTEVRAVHVVDGRATGVETSAGVVAADTVVVAAGAWSASIEGLPADAVPPVRPIRGQIVRLTRTRDFALAHIVRGPRAYLLPKTDGSVVVGATQEEAGFDLRATAGGIKDILAYAWELVPSLYDLPFEGVEVGLRPGSRDHRPLIGETRVRGLVMATGHFRHGILLAPATADAVRDGIVKGVFGDEVAAFAPSRFAGTTGEAGA